MVSSPLVSVLSWGEVAEPALVALTVVEHLDELVMALAEIPQACSSIFPT